MGQAVRRRRRTYHDPRTGGDAGPATGAGEHLPRYLPRALHTRPLAGRGTRYGAGIRGRRAGARLLLHHRRQGEHGGEGATTQGWCGSPAATLPFLERVAELYWGESEVEALYNDVVKHDNVAANMAALTFRANVDTMEVQNLDQLFSVTSGEQQRRFWNVMQAQSVMKSNFGMQLVNRGDQIKNTQYTFTGLQEVYDSMCLDLSGASRIPVTKLFGRSPAGMNATGESDLRNYYDYVDTLREAKLRPILEKLLPVLAMSAWGAVPDGLDITFPPCGLPRQARWRDRAEKGPPSGIPFGGPVPGGHGSEGAQEAGGRDRDV